MTHSSPSSSPGLAGELLGVYRTLPSTVLGWVMVTGAALLAALTVWDVSQGRDEGLIYPAALIVGIAAVAWVLFLRPHVRLHSDGVLIANIVTDSVVPFAAVEDITHQWALEVHDTQGRKHSAWAIPVKRERARRRGIDDFAETTTRRRGSAGRTAQGVADEAQRALQRWRLDGGQLGGPHPEAQAEKRPAWAAVAVLGVALLLIVLAVLG
ncbi:hypothetical protein [Ornithinimicrobium sufpigmenti]|uniref:hypothetical protein n=1 Tax=Ornithinimicrobium sufpigmenti TaxID=2508882 RepID=UPI0010361C8B|nr:MULTISPECIES: hypothetical protein [unclassified Ornithinimicrobium]